MLKTAATAIGKNMPALVALVTVVVVLAAPALAAPEAELWERWTRHDVTSDRTIDHSRWDSLLKRHVVSHEDGVARVSYSTFSEADEAVLLTYIKQLEAVPVSSLSRAEQFAYWVNLYNSVTVALIVQSYPVETIRDIDISPGFFSDGPWGKKLVEVEGEGVSLDDIEHRILRPIWKDPRIHYAVNCASIGCPDLWPEALTAVSTEAYLERAARTYVNHPRGASMEDGKLYVSSIYSWFEADFGGSEAGVINHLRRYADAGLKAALMSIENIAGDRYDWSLNSLKPVPKTAKNKNISPGS